MFCPECETEYRDGVERCSDCDVPLVAELADDDAHFTSTDLVLLAHDRSSELITELLDRLEKAGVPYVIEAGTALSMLNESRPPLEEPEPWEARVWIAAAFKDRATRILDQIK